MMVRIPGTTFSDYAPKTDWKKAFDEQLKKTEEIRVTALLDACKAICGHCKDGNKPRVDNGLIEHFKEGSCSFCTAQRIRLLLPENMTLTLGD